MMMDYSNIAAAVLSRTKYRRTTVARRRKGSRVGCTRDNSNQDEMNPSGMGKRGLATVRHTLT